MWQVLVVQFNFELLINNAGEVQLITLFLHLFCPILGVLGFVRKLGISAFRRMFKLINVGSSRLTIQLRVFKK